MAKTGHLKTGRDELLKQFFVYDGSNRVTDIYEAHADANHGQPCLRTRYTYDGTSNRVLKMKEVDATWDSSYELS